jgi:hypothetical protein
MLIEIVKVLLALCASLVGAYLGARLGLTRFKLEKSYERRYEWHSTALSLIQDLTRHVGDQLASYNTQGYQELRDRFSRLVAEAPAYTSRTVAMALVLADFQIWHWEHAEELYRGDSGKLDMQAVVGAWNDSKHSLSNARTETVSALRTLLPAEPEVHWVVRVREDLRRRYREVTRWTSAGSRLDTQRQLRNLSKTSADYSSAGREDAQA